MTVRRLKTYASSQGYVYEYYFVESGPALDEVDVTEYVFRVTTDRVMTYPVSVFLPPGVVRAWGERHGRELSAAEQYAAVKMRLFRAFDEVPDMRGEGQQLRMEETFMEEALAGLGVD